MEWVYFYIFKTPWLRVAIPRKKFMHLFYIGSYRYWLIIEISKGNGTWRAKYLLPTNKGIKNEYKDGK